MATSKAIVADNTEDGGWQVVRRRKPYPANWRQSTPPILAAKPYIPYPHSSYAQVVRNPPQPAMHHPTAPKPNTPPFMPKPQTTATVFYVSPHSPSRLRFPPSHTFPEWKGRCFRCCRTGHSAAKCRNPKRCGRCWSYGHIGSACKQDIVAPPPPVRTTPLPPPKNSEPGFEELLTGSYPYRAPEMPSDRPVSLHCFLERDSEYFEELDRLRQAVVMYTSGYQWDLSVDNAVTIACRTNKVQKEEISVSQMSGARFLIILPEGLHPDTFINATPQDLWDDGITFQPWTPLEDASISIPTYKVLLRLVGLPPPLYREKYVKQAIARFGVFLGSVEPENHSSIASWFVAVGVDDLSLVPPQLVVHIGGMMYYIQVYAEAYQRVPLYTAEDMPKHPKVYRRPIPPPPSSSSSDDDTMMDHNELIPMSTRVLREVCRGRTAESLPPELRQFAAMEEIEMPATEFATQDMATLDPSIQNQQLIPQIQQSVSQRIIDPPEQPRISSGVVGQKGMHPNLAHIPTTKPGHNNSQHNSPRCNTISVPPTQKTTSGDHSLSQHETGQSFLISDSHQGGRRRIQPQRILLRGESSTQPSNNSQSSPHSSQIPSKNSAFPQTATTATQIPKKTVSLETGFSKNNRQQILPPIPPPKPKGLPIGPLKGPLSSKYKWTRQKPLTISSSSQIIKKDKVVAQRPKAKGKLPSTASPPKRSTRKHKQAEQAQISLNPEGFYEVQVQYEHVAKLASVCGFKNRDVEEMLAIDNEQRKVQASTSHTDNLMITEEEPELDMGRFDPDPEDELTSEEEV